MKASKVGYVTLELTLPEAKILYQVCNWGDPVAELVGEKSADVKVASAVETLLNDMFEALDDLGVDEGE